jgi:hypothetical protein
VIYLRQLSSMNIVCLVLKLSFFRFCYDSELFFSPLHEPIFFFETVINRFTSRVGSEKKNHSGNSSGGRTVYNDSLTMTKFLTILVMLIRFQFMRTEYRFQCVDLMLKFSIFCK